MNRYDAFKILGLHPEATLDEARRAYREQVKLWHPDRYSDNSALKSMAMRNAQDANRAWAFLRSRLPQSPPPRPTTKTDRTLRQNRQGRHPEKSAGSSRAAGPIRYLRRCIAWAAPVIGQIRKIHIGDIIVWLREDPGRRYRPWFRYSRETGDRPPKSGSPCFRQTLTEVMKARSYGALTNAARPGRKVPPTHRASRSAEQRDKGDHGRLGSVDPVDRSHEA